LLSILRKAEADGADVFLFGGGPVIFQLDELLELGDRRELDFLYRQAAGEETGRANPTRAGHPRPTSN
jgi:hypothetical protein